MTINLSKTPDKAAFFRHPQASLRQIKGKAYALASALLYLAVLSSSTEAVSGEDRHDTVRLASTNGDIAQLHGELEPGDRGTLAIYGTLTITPTRISWEPTNSSPKCATSYQALSEASGVLFESVIGDKFMTANEPDHRYSTFLLKLTPKACVRKGLMYFRFTLDKQNGGYVDYTEYDSDLKPSAYGHFHIID